MSVQRNTIGRVMVVLVSLFIIIPVIATIVTAMSVNSSRGAFGDGVTLDWFVIAWNNISPMIVRSFLVALLVVALNILIVFPLAWYSPNLPGWIQRILLLSVNLPLAVPGIALSIALIGTFAALRPSGVLLIFGHLVLTMPFTLSSLLPSLRDPTVREAEQVARSLGASWPHVIRTVTVPWVNVALLQAITMVFAISFGEFNISFFINPPASPMAPFALFDAYSTQRLEIASAQSVIFILFTLPILAAVTWARGLVTRRKADS